MSTAVATMIQSSTISLEIPHQLASPTLLDSTRRSRRKVHFSRHIKTVTHVLSRRDYSNSELRECFYTPDDRYRMESDRRRLVRRVEKKEQNKKQQPSSLRGLECQTREGSIQSEKRVWAVIGSVLKEQDKQLELGDFDCKRIAAASQSNSRESVLVALRAAIGDQRAAFTVYREWALDNRAIFEASAEGKRSCRWSSE
ncbi:unnamed protein product [Cylindrotheca closterium]|uniref:Uncharacterized protein n=1 Tax=Cylindrotheca closterium TaxID=2856 RepID=A0AAD2GAC4_9STRA|nr:unnamed protein product [Cylindrotheca closterium]